MVVNVDASVLDEDEGVRCELDGGPGLAAETARRLACDATVVPVVRSTDGDVVGIGVPRRTVPRWLRRMLHARDGGCRFPGYGERRVVIGHHLRHWSRGGPTVLANLVELCAFHHRLVHEGGWTVLLGAEGAVTFTDPRGNRFTDRLPGGSAEPH